MQMYSFYRNIIIMLKIYKISMQNININIISHSNLNNKMLKKSSVKIILI